MVADRSKIPLPASMLNRGNITGRQVAAPPKSTGKPAIKKRRGFGLFSEDEGGEETEAESSRLSVSFSGNKSGFEELGKAKGRRMSADGTGMFSLFFSRSFQRVLF